MKNFAIGIVAVGLMCSGAFAQEAGVDPASGKSLWEGSNTQCRTCHGRLGEGAFGPPLAGRNMSAAEFRQAARKPWGIMPAFTTDQVSDSDLANFAAYLGSLPKAVEPGPWQLSRSAGGPAGPEDRHISGMCAMPWRDLRYRARNSGRAGGWLRPVQGPCL